MSNVGSRSIALDGLYSLVPASGDWRQSFLACHLAQLYLAITSMASKVAGAPQRRHRGTHWPCAVMIAFFRAEISGTSLLFH